ncbi:MAG: hypothetical protein D3905_13705, partial [Candidatus Electrothrix sp. AS4_5]|nr:hypothetical protein [Candidatus Electrothrix gigas]
KQPTPQSCRAFHLHPLFAENIDPRAILRHLELKAGRITPGRTLVFFDEIQANQGQPSMKHQDQG